MRPKTAVPMNHLYVKSVVAAVWGSNRCSVDILCEAMYSFNRVVMTDGEMEAAILTVLLICQSRQQTTIIEENDNEKTKVSDGITPSGSGKGKHAKRRGRAGA
jgi:hypothetical protein